MAIHNSLRLLVSVPIDSWEITLICFSEFLPPVVAMKRYQVLLPLRPEATSIAPTLSSKRWWPSTTIDEPLPDGLKLSFSSPYCLILTCSAIRFYGYAMYLRMRPKKASLVLLMACLAGLLPNCIKYGCEEQEEQQQTI